MDTKTKSRTPPREPAYDRLTDEKRIIIETLAHNALLRRHALADAA